MSAARVVRVALILLSVGIAGCVARGPALPEPAPEGTPRRAELSQTPFFPQVEYECGPAALATVLAASGLQVVPADIEPEVYLPGRRGSLQAELVASTRRRGHLPYVLPMSADAILLQVAAGFPVIILQKLGAGPWPGWHYAVVVGYDLDSQTMLLRSGTERRLEMSAARFMTTWDRGGRWAMVVLRPGQLPASPDASRYLESAAALEAIGQRAAARESYEAAAAHWPADSLPQIALGNVALTSGDFAAAEHAYREAARLDPGSVVARNNLAEVLLGRGCPAAARAEVDVAVRLAADGPYAAAVRDTERKIAAVPGPDHQGCPVPEAESHSRP